MKGTKRKKRGLREKQLAYLLVIPALVVIFSIALYPLANTFWLSLHKIYLIFPGQRPFVGLNNYTRLFSTIRFWADLWHTLYFTGVSVGLELLFGLAVALALHKEFAGRGWIRAAVLIPWAIPTIVSARMWQWMYNDNLGVFNAILRGLGLITENVVWLGTTKTAMLALIVTDVWKTTPFMALLLLAGLQIIPEQLYEAARIDGASWRRQFISITLPLLKPTILVALIFRTLDALRVFDIIFVMTKGAFNTETLAVYNYQVLMPELRFGYGSAISVMIFLFIFLIAMAYIKILGLKFER